MIYIPKAFRLKVIKCADGYFCPATEQRQSNLWPQDYVMKDDDAVGVVGLEDAVLIASIHDLRHHCRPQFIVTWFIAVASVIAMVITLWHTVSRYMSAGFVWDRWLMVGVFAILSMLYLTQAIRPVAHDREGFWVNLRSGDTNLHGGCKLVNSSK